MGRAAAGRRGRVASRRVGYFRGVATDDFAALDALPTSELKDRAFRKADHARDIGFFWDLIKHLGASEAIGSDDGSAGGLGEGIGGAVDLVRELLGHHEESMEPMLRARYIDYLLKTPAAPPAAQ